MCGTGFCLGGVKLCVQCLANGPCAAAEFCDSSGKYVGDRPLDGECGGGSYLDSAGAAGCDAKRSITKLTKAADLRFRCCADVPKR